MHSLLILIFISVSIFFFTLLGCVFLSHPFCLLSVESLLSESWLESCWGWLVSAIKWTNEGYKTIRFGFLFFRVLLATSSLCVFLFCFAPKVFYYYMYFLFLVDLSGWSLYLYLCQDTEHGHAKCFCLCMCLWLCLCILLGAMSLPWVWSGFMLSRWVFLFAFWVCLLTRQMSVCPLVLSCVLFM